MKDRTVKLLTERIRLIEDRLPVDTQQDTAKKTKGGAETKKNKQQVKCFKCSKVGHYANKCRGDKSDAGMVCCMLAKHDRNIFIAILAVQAIW